MQDKKIQYIKISSLFTKSTFILFIVLFVSNMFIIAILFSTASLDVNMSSYENKINIDIKYKNNSIYLTQEGKKFVLEKNLWFQMVNDSLKEVYSYNKPKKVPNKYSPIKFVNTYKYDIDGSTVFIYEKDINGKKYSYFLGVPIDKVAKYNIQYSPTSVRELLNKIVLIIIMNILFIIGFGYFYFSKKMGNPLQKIVDQIVIMSQGDYNNLMDEKGIYKNIFRCINKLTLSLKKSKHQKEELDETRERWISSISHDMKTPLSSIKGFAEILDNEDYNFSEEEVSQYISIIYEKSVYLEELISDLNFSYKLKNSSVPVKLEVFNLTEFLNILIKRMLSNPKFLNKNIYFNSFSNNILIEGDIHLLKRAFSNLIINFLIYNNDETNITVDILKYSDNIEVRVKDNGRGIPPNEIPYIFEQYYRGTNTTTNSNGSGLGLAIANEIILLHKGKCKIDSKIGDGTTLRVLLNSKFKM